MSLKNKVVIVTGGNSGIGRAAALAFARAGARVVIAARREPLGQEVVREIQAGGGEAAFVRTDVSRAAEVEHLVAETVRRYGRLDCAFNNAAAYAGALLATADYTEEEFDHTLAVDLKGVWLCMKYEIRQMLAQNPPGGAIVNTSSASGLGGSPMAAPYSAAKSGIHALTKSAAQEYARQNIRINALVAGAFWTPMQEWARQKLTGGDPEALRQLEKSYLERIPLGRVGDPEEAAAAALWLCSDAASYVTGASIAVDGGWSAHLYH